ncbi:MAG TPA: ATP-binding cassette domain-containing protein [Gammaproteobacteria bacterium]|nr:ATP-binding cassette domain-containing protein [Gammaproteobacteria bacterium]
MNQPPLIDVQSVSVALGGRSVLHNVSLQIREREIISLIGPNGAGKTTLVKTLLGLLQPAGGRVLRRPRLRMAYLPQRLRIDPALPMTVQRFLELCNRGDVSAVQGVLEETGVSRLRGTPLQSVSGGEFQRVMLARCLLLRPELLVLDEPGQGMDVTGQEELYGLVKTIRDRYGCGILLVSHDLHFVMAATDHVVCLHHHVCCTGHPEAITGHPEFLRLFGRPALNLALYTHEHDHAHDLHGDVVDE